MKFTDLVEKYRLSQYLGQKVHKDWVCFVLYLPKVNKAWIGSTRNKRAVAQRYTTFLNSGVYDSYPLAIQAILKDGNQEMELYFDDSQFVNYSLEKDLHNAGILLPRTKVDTKLPYRIYCIRTLDGEFFRMVTSRTNKTDDDISTAFRANARQISSTTHKTQTPELRAWSKENFDLLGKREKWEVIYVCTEEDKTKVAQRMREYAEQQTGLCLNFGEFRVK